jgi:cation diffusion facilitator CzcD-associated flavoprotein CzcO
VVFESAQDNTGVEQRDVVVIGAGKAGLSAAYHLRRREVDFVVLDGEVPVVRGDIGGSRCGWRP